eukprot:747593_1
MSAVLLLYLFICLGQGIDVFVSRNGTDSDGCGSIGNHCVYYIIAIHILIHLPMCQCVSGGTLYYASFVIYFSSDEYCSLHLIDGQNITEIERYFASQPDSTSHPCLPHREAFLNTSKSITISFDSQYINDFNDWFVRDICDSPTNKAYSNKYMFNGAKAIEINHLIINDYHSSLSNFYN